MREDSMLFLTVIDEIQPIADQYRSDIKHRYSPNPKASATSNPSGSTVPNPSNDAGHNDPSVNADTDGAEKSISAPITDHGTVPPTGNGKPVPNPTNTKHLINYALNIPRNLGKIRNIYLELKNKLNVQETPYSTAALLRSLIELSCDYYILHNGAIVFNDGSTTDRVSEGSKLRVKILGVAQDIHHKDPGLINQKQLATLKLECPKRGTDTGSLDILHSTLHNYSHEISPQQIIVAHNNFEPLISAIWRK